MGGLTAAPPARLDGRTIAWEGLEMQAGDEPPTPFSFLTEAITTPQGKCGVTYTTAETHRIIAGRLGESAGYGGKPAGPGPRPCPPILGKSAPFADHSPPRTFLA